MNKNVINIIINELLPHADEIEMQGTGESLLSNEFFNLFLEANKYDKLKKILITNASLINDSYIELFVNSNMDLIISLDGADHNSFELNRPCGSFERIVSTLTKLGEYKKKINNINFTFVINMVATNQNYHCIRNLIMLAKKINVDFVHISEVRECMPDQETWNKFRLDNIKNYNDFNYYIKDCSMYASELEIGFSFNEYNKYHRIKKPICVSPWQHIFVCSDGNVSFCCEQNKYIGNLNNSTFEELWNSSLANNFRKNMIIGDYDEICCNCCLPWGITYE